MTFLQEWQADIRVSINSLPIGDAWATYAGGDLVVADGHTRPGNMGYEVSTGGPSSRQDVTATTQMTEAFAAAHPGLEILVNQRAKVTVTLKDLQRNVIPGSTFSRVGTLKSAAMPNQDANSNTQAFYTIIVSCDELAAS